MTPQIRPAARALSNCRHPPRIRCIMSPSANAGNVRKFGIRLLLTSNTEATNAQAVAVAGYVNMGWGKDIDRSCKAEMNQVEETGPPKQLEASVSLLRFRRWSY